MAQSKPVSMYLPDNIIRELDEIKEYDGATNTSQYLRDLIHLTYLMGGVRAMEKRLMSPIRE